MSLSTRSLGSPSHNLAVALRAWSSPQPTASISRAADYRLTVCVCCATSHCGIRIRERSNHACPVRRLGHNMPLRPGIAGETVMLAKFRSAVSKLRVRQREAARRQTQRRTLRAEPLEGRLLMTGDSWVVPTGMPCADGREHHLRGAHGLVGQCLSCYRRGRRNGNRCRPAPGEIFIPRGLDISFPRCGPPVCVDGHCCVGRLVI